MPIRMKAGLGAAAFLAALLAVAQPARCQAQSQDQKPPQDQASQQQQPQQETDSLAEAARKAKANKPKTETKKVYTTEDIATSHSGNSAAGEKDSGANGDAAGQANKALGKAGMATGGGGAAPSGPAKGEAYWRGRAQQLRDQMTQVDAEIAQVQDEIKKGGNAGFNVQSGLKTDTVYFEDRDTKLKRLQQKKAAIQKQIDDLEDEARKADVPSSWIR